MIRSNLVIAIRSLRRQPVYAAINIVGLAVGVACCALILLHVKHERSYDRHFPNHDRLFRVVASRESPNDVVNSARTPRPLANSLSANFRGVAAATRLSRERADRVLIRHDETAFFEEHFFFADSNFFDVFATDLLSGDSSSALRNPFSIILTPVAAERYFGKDNPLGKVLDVRLQGDGDVFSYTVTGVMRRLPPATHFHPDFIASYAQHPLVSDPAEQENWSALTLYTYVRLRQSADQEALMTVLPKLVREKLGPQIEEALDTSFDEYEAAGNRFRYAIQPLEQIHLRSHRRNEIEVNGNAQYVQILLLIALFILLLGCINFVNLTTASAGVRAREVGIRKAIGSGRAQLVGRFLTESAILGAMAVAVAFGIVNAVAPGFEHLTGSSLDLAGNGVIVAAELFAILLGVAVAAGTYPAWLLSGFEPARVLKGGRGGPAGSTFLRNSLVVLQFAIAACLMIGTAVIHRQLTFLETQNLGFDKSNLVVISGTETIRKQIETFKDAVSNVPGVAAVSNGQAVPGEPLGQTAIRRSDAGDDEQVTVSWLSAGYGYDATLGMNLVYGRGFERERASDSMAVILNESAIRALSIADPKGSQLVWRGRRYTVVGVVSDFNYASMHEAIGPVVLFGPDPFNQNRPNLNVAVRVSGSNIDETLKSIEDVWQQFAPNQPMSFRFLDDSLGKMYAGEGRIAKLVGAFSILAIVIACLGLFGLASFAIERRTKEIGVRKVLGATLFQIVVLLSRDLLALVAAACLVSIPIATIAVGSWLSGFAYHYTLDVEPFAVAVGFALAVAMLTVSVHAVRFARMDPIVSLRYD